MRLRLRLRLRLRACERRRHRPPFKHPRRHRLESARGPDRPKARAYLGRELSGNEHCPAREA